MGTAVAAMVVLVVGVVVDVVLVELVVVVLVVELEVDVVINAVNAGATVGDEDEDCSVNGAVTRPRVNTPLTMAIGI